MRNIVLFIFCFIVIHSSRAQLEEDKALHFLGGNLYGLVGAGVANQISKGDRTWTFVGSLGGSLLIGLAKESIDEKQYGGWDNNDLLATVLGGATVGVTIDIFKKKKKKRRERRFKEAIGYDIKIDLPLKHIDTPLTSLQLLGISSAIMEKYRNP
ncbi:hypothetical protein [Maribacter sp. 2304DJ31-5]|uniref:hypothetical protein n=1 Tax=Maribacter sp. 2304DJ31-5 TaxID=3386273 RepID=UPI0039BC577C